MTLGVYDLSRPAPAFERFADTEAWCWQQGCRLQWYPADGGDHVLFNFSRAGRHAAAIVNPRNGARVETERPMYALSRNGRLGVSLNFARLQRLRPGYGYGDLVDSSERDAAPADDGLWFVDMDTQATRAFLSLAEIAAYKPHPSADRATHYFNHVLWNPRGSRCFFLHCWNMPDGRRRSRALVWEEESGRYWLLGPTGHVSHHCWLDDERIVVYGRDGSAPRRYYVYDASQGLIGPLGEAMPIDDGHPSLAPHKPGRMITDTYPDRLAEQSLILCDIARDTSSRLAAFHSPSAFRGERRCDLHPRWNRAGDRVCVDSAHAGYRQLCVVALAP